MTQIEFADVTCTACGSQSQLLAVLSSSSWGPLDLDTREEGSAAMLLQSCWCGLVAPNLERASAREISVVQSEAYREACNAERAKGIEYGNDLTRRSILAEMSGDLVEAAWRRVHAAWQCDDWERPAAARQHRLDALELFERARGAGARVLDAPQGVEFVLFADLARRAGEFERAVANCKAGLGTLLLQAGTLELLHFEKNLASARDTGRYNEEQRFDRRDWCGADAELTGDLQVIWRLQRFDGQLLMVGRSWSDGVWQFARVNRSRPHDVPRDAVDDGTWKWEESMSHWIEGWEAGLDLFRGHNWAWWEPVAVHPDFIDQVRAVVTQRLRPGPSMEEWEALFTRVRGEG